MVPDINKPGGHTLGLLSYLYDISEHEDHVDPHIVAAYDPHLQDPGRHQDATLAELADDLDHWVRALKDRAPARHVWHCSVRTAPTDRVLSDEEWATVARRVVHATGIAPEGDDQGCRWVAVWHAPDHIHIVATLVRADRTRPRRHREASRAQAECRKIEKELGLRRLQQGDGTAAQRPTSAERHKATRRGQVTPSRELLREHVRRAVAGAADEAEFFIRLAAEGVRIKARTGPSGDVFGYAVAVAGDRNKDGEPIWFSGSKLAPDLSLPRIRRRFVDAESEPPPLAGRTGESAPARARRFAAVVTDTAVIAIRSGSADTAAAQIAGVGEVLDALAQTSVDGTRDGLREAARAFERATRSHVRAEQAHAYALRRAARQIVHSGTALGPRDGTATALILDLLVLAAVATAHWHEARRHAQQAEAARQAAEHLRAAYRTAAAHPLAAMRAYGQRLPAPDRRCQVAVLHTVLPDLADRIRAEPGWPALTAVLDQAERAGHDAGALLRQAAAQRELGTADSLSEVLVWRLHGLDIRPVQGLDRSARAKGFPRRSGRPSRPPLRRYDRADADPVRQASAGRAPCSAASAVMRAAMAVSRAVIASPASWVLRAKSIVP
ncbi:relaxase/mobilization nuclease domain-containing protein [Streptomyces sp. NPDC059076]|uniref:relaxase/mobilization nuclease domain-containing protein n=1 Tax=unclassified Streptomyces TaxID=2593676 RepID=UPI0036C73D69